MSARITAINDFPVFGMAKRFSDAPLTGKEAMEMAGLDFTVEKKPICHEVKNDEGKVIDMVRSDKHYAMIRSDTNEILGPVGKRYKVVQNRDAFSFMDSLAGEGKIKYLAVGEMNGGAKVCLFASIPSLTFDAVPGDQIKTMFMLSLSHDGSAAILGALLSARYACLNLAPMLKSAVKDGDGVSIRHSGDVAAKLEQATEVMHLAKEQMAMYRDQVKFLVGNSVTDRFTENFLNLLFPLPEDGSNRSTRSQNQRNLVDRLIVTGRGTDISGVRGTRWGLLNALTEYTNHERGARAVDTRVNSLLFGNGALMNQTGFDFLVHANHAGELPAFRSSPPRLL